MIDPRTDTLIALNDVPRLRWLPRKNGKRLHVGTVHRWARKGLKNGLKLETIKIGGRAFTSEQALVDFYRKLADDTPRQSEPAEPSAGKQRRRTSDWALAALDAANV